MAGAAMLTRHSVYLHDDAGGVVFTTVGVGSLNEMMAGLLGRGGGKQKREHFGRGKCFGNAVGSEQEAVSEFDLYGNDFGNNEFGGTDGLGEDAIEVLLLSDAGRTASIAKELREGGMIVGESMEVLRTKEVGAAVADMRDPHSSSVEVRRHDGCTHSGVSGIAPGGFEYGAISGLDRTVQLGSTVGGCSDFGEATEDTVHG